MRLPRMTTRRWMIVVAVVAVMLGAERIRRRWVFCRDQAALYALQEAYDARRAEAMGAEVLFRQRNSHEQRAEAERYKYVPHPGGQRSGPLTLVVRRLEGG